MRSIDELPFLNFLSPEFQQDPGPIIEELRPQAPMARTPIGLLVLEHDAVVSLLADDRLVSSIKSFIAVQGVTQGPIYESLSRSLLALDGADHVRLRKLVSRAFTPRAVEKLRPSMRKTAEHLVDGFVSRGTCEFMGDFANHYPILLMCEMLGVPKEDHDDFARWNEQITWVLSFELAARMDEVMQGFDGLWGYIERLIEERRAKPEEDLVTRLILAEDGGDRLSPVELRSMIAGLLFAGYDTTRNQLGISMALFAEFPDQWKRLAAEPELAPRAVEESLRFLGAIAVAPRMAAQDMAIAGFHVPQGTMVSLGTGAANHDPKVFDKPLEFDISVERETQLTFGGGPHYCLGASLARAEMQEALPILARRLPDLAIDGEPIWRPRTGIFGPTALPIRFTPEAS